MLWQSTIYNFAPQREFKIVICWLSTDIKKFPNYWLFKFQRIIQRKFNYEEISNPLQSWHLLTFLQFLKELKKVQLGLSEEAKREEYFAAENAKAKALQMEIDQTDWKEFELYGLTDEEIKIVEGSTPSNRSCLIGTRGGKPGLTPFHKTGLSER